MNTVKAMNDFIRKTKLYGMMLGMCCLMAATISSCVQDDWATPGDSKDKAATITIDVAGVGNRVMTRAGDAIYSPRTDRSRVVQLDIVLAGADGNVKQIIPLDATTTERIALDAYSKTGLIEGSPVPVTPTDGTTTSIKFRIGKTDAKDVADIYVVANYINETGELKHLPTISTVNDLEALKQGHPTDENTEICTMFGHISVENDLLPESTNEEKKYNIFLKRTNAMVTLAIDGTNLHDGVVVTPLYARLVKVPKTCSITGSNAAGEGNIIEDGYQISQLNNSWGPVCKASTGDKYSATTHRVVPYEWSTAPELTEDQKYIAADGPHGTGPKVMPLFMFENLQGKTEGTDQVKKNPTESSKPYCTYIEVEAEYRYNTVWAQDSQDPKMTSNKFGAILYRFCLGENITNDFNVTRNKHYMLTLTLKGFGGLVENGNVNADGNWIADNADASWRVMPVFQGGGAVNDLLEVPANGSRVDFELQGYPEYDQIAANGPQLHLDDGSNNTIWLYNADKGSWDATTPGSSHLKQYLINNGGGNYTIQIYVKPFGKTEFDNVYNNNNKKNPNYNQGQLNTVEKWVKYGYMDHVFHITGFGKDSPLNDDITVRQWLPLPVMDPEDLNGSTNPYNATLYFSRFDIYHGKMLPWCHTEMQNQNMWDILVTDTDILKIWNNWTVPKPYQTYKRENGFHKTVAYFWTNEQKGTLDLIAFENGLPQTMMAYSFFAAANAENTADGSMFIQNANNVTEFTHYGLPSMENWEKIEKYGVQHVKSKYPELDNDYPLQGSYWTSTIEGNPADNASGTVATGGVNTMVYAIGRGGLSGNAVSAQPRALEYLGRLVYRKDAKATRE